MELRRELRVLMADPVEWLISARERVAERDEERARRTHSPGFMPWPPCPYGVDPEWERHLHDRLDVEWPCPEHARFCAQWPSVLRDLETRVSRVGRGSFGVDGWGDGDAAFARTVFCLTSHLHCDAIVETGVGRGITSRFILEALAQNQRGHLWSIDLPMVAEPEWAWEIGIAVPPHLRARWTLIRGSSRRRLGRVLADAGPIDLFVHDSRHTTRNLLFELERAWKSLTPRGALVPDDIDLNCALHAFERRHHDAHVIVGRAEPQVPDIGRQDDSGVFGVIFRTR